MTSAMTSETGFTCRVLTGRYVFMVLLLAFSGITRAADTLHIPRAVKPPVLADYVTGVPANAGVEITDFRQRKPGDGIPASQATRAYLSYDDTHFYAVFVARDDPALVKARVGKRQDFLGDDYVILELDTFNDKQRAFEFFVNPYGVQLDAKRTEGQETDYDFETQWQSDGQLTSDGYVAMLAIPFKSLRFRNQPVQTWGIAVGRLIARLNEASYWPAITQREAAFIPQFATAEIPEQITPGRNLQLMPYTYMGKSRILNKDGNPAPYWEKQSKIRGGLDAKWVFSEAMAIDMTINPDFSEVESDEPQVIIDKRYEVLFPEKRPFFLENSGFFQTAQPLFFSRRIADPKYGARLTGREGSWAFGSLLINDDAPGQQLPAGHAAFGKTANISVLRVQNDIADGSNLGAILTQRKLGNMSSQVAGLDLQYQWDQNWLITTQVSASKTVDADNRQSQGRLAYAEFKRTDKNLNYSGKWLSISPEFDTRLGFIPRADLRQTTQTLTYLWDVDEHPWIQNHGPQITAIASKDHQNTLQDWSADSAYIVNGTGSTVLEAHLLNAYERYDQFGPGRYHKNGYLLAASSDRINWLSFDLKAGKNEVINYLPATGQASQLGDSRSLAAILTAKLNAHFRVEQTLLWNDLRLQKAVADQRSGSMIYRDLLSRTRFSYQHDRYWGLRLVLDYDFLKVNPGLTSLAGGKRLNSDIQVSYVLSPGTSFYAGFADRQENLRLLGNPLYLQATDKLDLHTGRQVFVKFNYLFQL